MTGTSSVATLSILRMGQDGDGVGVMPDGRLAFVAGALPGETVAARVIDERPRFVRAALVEVLDASAERDVPPCPAYETCGGCTFQHWRYTAELAYKADRVRDAFSRLAGLPDVRIEPIRGARNPYGYRGKASFPWGGRVGETRLGLYRRGTHQLVPLSACLIQAEGVNRVLEPAVRHADALGLAPYDEARGEGLLRHLVVRESRADMRVAVMPVATAFSPAFPEWARRVMNDVDVVSGVAVNLNARPGNRILGPETRTVRGDPRLTEVILGARFIIEPDAFFQVNAEQVAVLYQAVLDALHDAHEAWDLYAGVGTLAVLMARRGMGVRAVDVVPSAVAAGRMNASANGVAVDWREAAVEDVLPAWLREDGIPEAVVVDPPRAGLAPAVTTALAASSVPLIVYVSCRPESLARDVGRLAPFYEVKRVVPVDLFPRTDHVECVVTLERRART